jgi:hypothetical protein
MLLLPLALAAAAGGKRSVKLTYFGDVEVADGELVVMDGGIHGVQGHTLRVAPDGSARWERRVESLQPSGKPGAGSARLSADEAGRVKAWGDAVWPLGGKSWYPPPDRGPPRWVWAIVLRRGDEIRALEGGATAPPDGAPDAARPLLKWLVEKVDALAKP